MTQPVDDQNELSFTLGAGQVQSFRAAVADGVQASFGALALFFDGRNPTAAAWCRREAELAGEPYTAPEPQPEP